MVHVYPTTPFLYYLKLGFLVSIFPELISSLKLTGTVVPYYGILHHEATLVCRFELEENESLYSVKWYKDGHEFFRYKPAEEPPIIVFPVVGVTVNESRSSLYHVLLSSITLNSKGDYRCEVSLDAPTFQTVYEEKTMRIMVLPLRGPKITGILPWYNVGENFTANCTVKKSSPQSKLVWFINDAQIDGEVCDCITSEVVDTGRTIDGTHFYNTFSQLQFYMESHYFRDGSLIVECKAIFRKSHVILKDRVITNIKAGIGLRQYAFSAGVHHVFELKISLSLLYMLLLICLSNVSNNFVL